VTVVRIFLREGEHLLSGVLKFLHDEEKIAGVTVFQGISGFGPDGQIRTSHLVDLSMDLPLVVEFYDQPEKVEKVISYLQNHMGLNHILSWEAIAYSKDG